MAIVLCCLEGQTRAETAARLGCTTGALRGWLERGRSRLQARLRERGVTLRAALTAALAVPCTGAGASGAAPAFQVDGVSSAAARLAAQALYGSTQLIASMILLTCVVGSAALWLLMSGISVPAAPSQEKPNVPGVVTPARVDSKGDPLPPEALARIGSVRLRTDGAIAGLTYAADDNEIISAALDGSVQFWSADTGQLQRSVPAQVGRAVAVALARDGKGVHLFSGTEYQALDAATGREPRRVSLTMTRPDYRARLAPDGSVVATAHLDAGEPIRVFDLASGAEKQSWKLDGANHALAFSPDSKTLAVGGAGGVVRIFEIATAKKRGEFKLPFQHVTQLEIAPDGRKLLAAGLLEPEVLVWDLKTGKEISRLRYDLERLVVHSLAFSPDSGSLAVSGQWEFIAVHDAATGKELQRFVTGADGTCVAFSRNGQTLLAGTQAGTIAQWDIATGKPREASAAPVSHLNALRFSSVDGRLLTLGQTFTAYDARTGREAKRYPTPVGPYRWSMSLAPDEKMLAKPNEDWRRIDVLDAATGKRLRTLPAGKGFVRKTQFSPDGKWLFSSSTDGAVRIWDVANGVLLHELTGHLPDPGLWPSPDGKQLATASTWGPRVADYDVRIWDTANWQVLHRLTPPAGAATALAFSPVGPELAVGCGTPQTKAGGGELVIFDVNTGKMLKTLAGHSKAITGAMFSPDGRNLATTSYDNSLRLWEVATGQERHRFAGHARTTHEPVFSLDGKTLAAASDDAPILLWDVYGLQAGHTRPFASATERAGAWQDLASADAKAAFQAVRRLVRSPVAAVSLLRERLAPAEAFPAGRLQPLIRDLDSEHFETRQTALAQLDQLGVRIEAHLQNAWRLSTNLETKRRLEKLIAQLDTNPERLRQVRALEVLEQIATPDALRLLEALAAGDGSSRLTRDATATRTRLLRGRREQN